ncbi:hypothetical protein EDB84DRAFT_1561760 [Lactarius hengduanensis]|nr:hypothetical protein EDB84DRAFT_1561760 [Lactarius hengduanensis]
MSLPPRIDMVAVVVVVTSELLRSQRSGRRGSSSRCRCHHDRPSSLPVFSSSSLLLESTEVAELPVVDDSLVSDVETGVFGVEEDEEGVDEVDELVVVGELVEVELDVDELDEVCRVRSTPHKNIRVEVNLFTEELEIKEEDDELEAIKLETEERKVVARVAHIPGPFCNVDIHTHPSSLQGPGLPPSNAVLPHPVPGGPPLPANYHQFRRGLSTFLFRLPLSPSSPLSIHFGDGLA